NQLIQELQPAAVRRGDAHSVLVTACNSVIIHHLRSVGCDYTLSVFLPECGMSKDKVLSARELLQLMKISPHTPFYKSLVIKLTFLHLFTELTEHHVYRDCCDASTQSTSISAHKESLVEKLQLIDEEYEELRHRGDRWASVEDKLAEYRKEIQEQAQVELKAKLQHFMEVEIAKVKRDEKEASRRQILELRRDMERTFELKSEALMSREKNAIERLQRSQEIEEKEMYAQRQALLKEIESVRSREIELKQRMEAFDKSCKLHEEKVKTMDDLLRRRELSVKTMEDTFDQKLKSQLEKYQLELKEDYTKRTEKLTENEKRIKEETARLQKESAIINTKAEEHERSLSEVKRLMMELESSRAQAALLTQQNELLRERLENLSDYPALKRDAQELQTNISLLKQQLEEKHQENQRLRQELSAPSKEQLALQAELRRLETARRLDEEDFETQKNVLHTQLQHEVQQCVLLKAQLMECEERVKWMNTHTEELQLQLQQTQQAGPALRGPWPAERDSELVSSALARIRELEQEAERLEEAYRSHQHRAARASAEDLTPLRVTYRAQPRVSFTSAGRPVEQEFSRTPSPRERNPLRLVSPPARRLSSTPLSKHGADADHHAFTQERRRTSPDSDRAALVFPERQISPIPAGDSLCSLSPPSSPRMKSTTRHSRRSHALTAAFTFTPSLTSSSVFTSIRAIFRAIREDQHEEQARDNTEDTEGHVTLTSAVIGGGAEEEGSGGADVANPLHKYMMMLMQDKQKQQVHTRFIVNLHLFCSVALISHEEPDDDFW
uniref:OFD1 centriole and centriolar satellite protein n=1 Tax=Cyprinus carpio TaxID=7962 RepID=A0A8C1QW09_CYPCA